MSKNIGIISKVRHLLPQQLTRNLYFTLVHPYITYCNLVWASPLKSTQLERVKIKQKKYCRLITFSQYTEPSRPLFIKLSILDVYDIHKYQLLTHIYSIQNKLTTNTYSQQYYKTNSEFHQYNTLQRETIFMCQCAEHLQDNTLLECTAGGHENQPFY